ncbi:Predicted ABC-type ATPase [Desulfonatronum zhilinae]|nr:Predicted ABC-type ATPase [Desulfonatronum zhilinae]
MFINADLIASGLSPFAPEKAALQAGRLMLKEIYRHVRLNESFAFETTLAGRGYAVRFPVWQAAGYRIKLIFLRLASVDLAIERVAVRVKQGGHDIPEAVIRRRYEAGWRNFRVLYRDRVDFWQVFDNSRDVPVLLEEKI